MKPIARLRRRALPAPGLWPTHLPPLLGRLYAARGAILALKVPRESEPTSLAELNRRLRQENAELRRTVKLARDSMAAMALRIARVVKEAERRVAAAERRAGRRTDSNLVAGQFWDERSSAADGKVVPLRKREGEAVT